MEPIVNPMLFYLIDLCDSVTKLLVIGGLVLFLLRWAMIYNYRDIEYHKFERMFTKGSEEFTIEKYEFEKATHKKYLKNLWVLIICWTLAVIIPSSETLTKMLIASQITTDRVEKSVEVVEKVYNDILARIDKE